MLALLFLLSAMSAPPWRLHGLPRCRIAVHLRGCLLALRCLRGALLFLGSCRHARGDYLYEDELAAALEGKLLGTLRCAFSRDGARKVWALRHVAARGRDASRTRP